MAKKRKTFKKEQLLSLLHNGNYQKVVSKIKQFTIDGMTQQEVDAIHIAALKALADRHFKEGDIARALRDIELVLSKEGDDNEARFLKLKFLAYLERFEEAVAYAEGLLEIRDKTIAKKVIFYYLVVHIYHDGRYEKRYLKKLAPSKQQYILFLEHLFAGDTEKAEHYLDACHPRSKREKENVNAIRAILKQDETFEVRSDLKPLYRLLLTGESGTIQNTKAVREHLGAIKAIFERQRHAQAYTNLLHRKSAMSLEEIKALYKRENDIKLVFNNIALLIDTKEYTHAYKIFSYFENTLVTLVESFFLLPKLEPVLDTPQTDRVVYNFFRKYLQLHREKFSTENIQYLFFVFCYNVVNNDEAGKNKMTPQVVNLATQYGCEHIPFAIYSFVNIDVYHRGKHVETLQKIGAKYTKMNEVLLNAIRSHLHMMIEVIVLGMVSEQKVEKKMTLLLEVLLEVEKIDQRLTDNLLQILDGIAGIFMEMGSISNDTVEYFEKLLERYHEAYQDNKYDQIEQLRNALDGNRRPNRKTTTPFADFDIEVLVDELGAIEEAGGNSFDYDPNATNKAMSHLLDAFKLALKKGEDPFEVLHNFEYDTYWYMFYNSLFEIPFLMMFEYARYHTLDTKAIQKIFKAIQIDLGNSDVKRSLLTGLKHFTHKELYREVSFPILEFLLDVYHGATTAWYLELIYLYLELYGRDDRQKSDLFFEYAEWFCWVQEQKRFKTMRKKYDHVLKMLQRDNPGNPEPKQSTLF